MMSSIFQCPRLDLLPKYPILGETNTPPPGGVVVVNGDKYFLKMPDINTTIDKRNPSRAIAVEVVALNELEHPGIVSLKGYHVCFGRVVGLYLEYLESGEEYLESGRFTKEQLLPILSYIHSKGWVHGDLIKSNICSRNGNPVIIDFDSAGRIGEVITRFHKVFFNKLQYTFEMDYEMMNNLPWYLCDNQ